MYYFLLLLLPLWLFASEISLQVLGSGGPENTERASSSYLIKKDGKAVVLVDFGGGAFLRFAQSKADIKDLDVILITHLHIDHVVDIPALMKAGYFSRRSDSLPIIGPDKNEYFPSISEYLKRQFGKEGAYAYMSDILSIQSDSFTIIPHQISSTKEFMLDNLKITAVPVEHGIVPTLAYKVEIEGKRIVFSGDTTAENNSLERLAKDADILIAHHAIPQDSCHAARQLHMTPQRIAQIASYSKPKTLLLSHRMKRTYGTEQKSTQMIKNVYSGKIIWAEDLMEIKLP